MIVVVFWERYCKELQFRNYVLCNDGTVQSLVTYEFKILNFVVSNMKMMHELRRDESR